MTNFTARKTELKEIIENMQGNIDQLTEKSQTMEQRAIEAEAHLVKLREDLERFQQFEKEVKEKNLLIGKLRHEAVTLNDHLTKALRMLKKGNASDNVDKYVPFSLSKVLMFAKSRIDNLLVMCSYHS